MNTLRVSMLAVKVTRVSIVVNIVHPKMPYEAMCHETTPLQKAINLKTAFQVVDVVLQEILRL